ncbi:MAG: helix-turn-helix domain-containing protein [Patescibacteria group bacterium]
MQIGFTEKEAQIYLMLLRIGPAPASLLAKRVGMKRVTTYSVLESLSERGVVSFEEMKNGRRYVPHDPECLLYGIEKQYSEVQFKMEVAKSCINQLQNVGTESVSSSRKTILHYGKKAVQRLLEEKIHFNEKLFVVFAGFGNKSSSTELLQQILLQFEKNSLKKTSIIVPEKFFERAGQTFKLSLCLKGDLSNSMSGDLLLQGDRLIFLSNKETSIHAMQMDDVLYSRFVRDVLLTPFISS